MPADSVNIRAAVCRQFGAPLQIETLRLAPPAAHEVRVKLAACAICHSDITYMDGGWGGTPPIVFGHEGAGVVIAADQDAGVTPGTPVLVTLLRSCGDCSMCRRDAPALCQDNFNPNSRLSDSNGHPVAIGLKTGAFAEQVVVDRSQIYPLPAALPLDEACLLACGVLTGWGAVANTAQVPPGARVAVVGCGGVGLNCLQAAAEAGASPIVAIDIAAEKLTQAKQFGATDAIAADAANAPAQALALTDGAGFDYVFMAAGSARAAELAAELLAPLGALVLVGMPPDGDLARLNTTTLANSHQRVLGSKMGGARLPTDMPKLLEMHRQGRLKLRELIGGRYPFERINDAIADARKGGALRNVVLFE